MDFFIILLSPYLINNNSYRFKNYIAFIYSLKKLSETRRTNLSNTKEFTRSSTFNNKFENSLSNKTLINTRELSSWLGKIMFAYLKRLWWECIAYGVDESRELCGTIVFLARLSNGGTMSPVCRYFKAVECKRATDLEERRPHDLWMKFWFRVPTRTVPFVHWSWFIASDSTMPVSSIENRLLLARIDASTIAWCGISWKNTAKRKVGNRKEFMS